MRPLRQVALLFILIGVSLPLILSLFFTGYSQSADLMVNIQQMQLLLKRKMEPVFKNALLDDVGIFRYKKYKKTWPSDSKKLIPAYKDVDADKNFTYDFIEISLEGHGLVLYFPKNLSMSEIATVINQYSKTKDFPAPIPQNSKSESTKAFTLAVRFLGYRDAGVTWAIPFSVVVAGGLIMVFAGIVMIITAKGGGRQSTIRNT